MHVNVLTINSKPIMRVQLANSSLFWLWPMRSWSEDMRLSFPPTFGGFPTYRYHSTVVTYCFTHANSAHDTQLRLDIPIMPLGPYLTDKETHSNTLLEMLDCNPTIGCLNNVRARRAKNFVNDTWFFAIYIYQRNSKKNLERKHISFPA